MKKFKIYLEKVSTFFESQKIENVKDYINDLLIDINTDNSDQNKVEDTLNTIFSILNHSFDDYKLDSEESSKLNDSLERLLITINFPKNSFYKKIVLNSFKKFFENLEFDKSNYKNVEHFIGLNWTQYISDKDINQKIKSLKKDFLKIQLPENRPFKPGSFAEILKKAMVSDFIYSFNLNTYNEELDFFSSVNDEELYFDFKKQIVIEKKLEAEGFKIEQVFNITKDKIELNLEIDSDYNDLEYHINFNNQKRDLNFIEKSSHVIDLEWNQNFDIFIGYENKKLVLLKYRLVKD